MTSEPAAASHRFLVELWLEPRELPVPVLGLRGRITDLASGRRRGVSSPEHLISFIDEVFDAEGHPRHHWPGGS